MPQVEIRNPGPAKVSKAQAWCRGLEQLMSIGNDTHKRLVFLKDFGKMMKDEHCLEPDSLEMLRDMYKEAQASLKSKEMAPSSVKQPIVYDQVTQLALSIFGGKVIYDGEAGIPVSVLSGMH